MSDADKLTIIQSLLCLFGERYVHTDDAQALHDCKYRRDEFISAYSAIMAIVDDYTSRDDRTTEYIKAC